MYFTRSYYLYIVYPLDQLVKGLQLGYVIYYYDPLCTERATDN